MTHLVPAPLPGISRSGPARFETHANQCLSLPGYQRAERLLQKGTVRLLYYLLYYFRQRGEDKQDKRKTQNLVVPYGLQEAQETVSYRVL